MTTVAITSQGTKLFFGSTGSPNDYNAVPGITSINTPTSSNPEIDASDLDSTSKEFIAGLKDNGEMSFTLNFNPDNAIQQSIRTAFVTAPSPTKSWVIQFSDTAPATRWEFAGFIKSLQVKAGVDEKLVCEVSVRVTGDVTQYTT